VAPIVTLLSDFGLADTYVGQVKGAVLRVAPGVALVDLTHAVPPQDVRAGAFLLWTAVEAFPAGTLHLAVVDPGVGSARRAIAARAARGDHLVGPDNGLLVPALERLGGVVAAVELTEPAYWGGRASATFHGRDIFGPVVGHLAAGVPLARLGPPVAELSRPFALPAWRRDGARLVGEVLHVDGYGNLVTSIPAGVLPPRFRVRTGRHAIADAPHPHYQAVPAGCLLALVGSAGLLEVAAREASAAAITGAGRGHPVAVDPL
jgi:S-adenosyl-L-methionine hydrolase (adenosine-forming)